MNLRIFLAVILVTLSLPISNTSAQEASATKRVVVLYWYDKNYPGHVRWDRGFTSALWSTNEGSIEYYPEYLEANRFPGETQSQILRDYLKHKYADRKIDVVVAQSDVSLNFLVKYKNDLFPDTPVVFYSAIRPGADTLAERSNITGVVVFGGFKKTIDCALTIHPETEQVFIISGSLEHDRRFENRARSELKDLEANVKINYLTDLSPAELRQAVARLPQRSLVLYVWQQVHDEQGKLMETADVLASISSLSPVPIYGMSSPLLGQGIVGGYVYTPEAGAARVAEMVRLIAGGRPGRDIPIENVHTIPMFDWRQLQRWQIAENKLPPGSIVQFRELTLWQQYKWRIVAVVALLLLQTSFIAVLLVERKRRRRAKEALAQLNAELETRIEQRTAALNAKSRELESFAYSVAHDLKAPLRGIDGYSRLLLAEHQDKLDDDGRTFLQTIRNSTEEMNRLIDDLLAYSRLERRELTTDRIELGPLVNALVEEKRREEIARAVDFVVNVNGTVVQADASGLIQSLRNYLDNAIKFTGKTSAPRIEVGSTENDLSCVLWVRDNGIGFDMKDRYRIFDIFQRLEVTANYPGTGIGLAIVRKAMERMGGRAWAESKPGQGATFYLEVPK
ncbi:MAG TPA: ATP-binding protein [Pyrinomonadaceae bacterium]|nr:ATP-binding protein [Pyrinomonadaceae bacterium]